MTHIAQDIADVLVLGAGAAGMTAALALRARGLNVTIVESTQQVGGTTSTSAGTLWLPCSQAGEDQKLDHCRAAAVEYLQACIGPTADMHKIDALLASGRELLDFLHTSTEVRLDAVAMHPDYLQSLPGATAGGRAFAPREFDGRRLGREFARVRAPLPEFMVLGGMMVSKSDIPLLLTAGRSVRSFVHAARLVSRFAVDRMCGRRGSRLVMGNALVAQLYVSALVAGARFLFGTQVKQLIRAGGGYVAEVEDQQGAARLHVRQAVVLATGGFSGSAAMRHHWFAADARALTVAHAGNIGGGIALGRALGGAVEEDHAQPAFWMPVSTRKRADGSTAIFPHIVLDRAKPGCIAVDGAGRRFVNEADAYHHFCTAMLAHETPVDSSRRFFLVADRRFVQQYGIGMIRPGANITTFRDEGYLLCASSPEDMAEALDIDAQAFGRSLKRFNVNAATGTDPDFHRGESLLNRHNGDAAHTPNPCLRPLDIGDLCAVELKVADLATSIGLTTDADARVLNAQGDAISGLYACGNDMASMMRGAYPGPGTTLGPGMVFAWRAAQHIATAAQTQAN